MSSATGPTAVRAERGGGAPVAPARVDWVDYARGLGIFLVVAGHCLGGLRSAGILADTPALHFAIAWIYSFHMPLFFFLSGLFVLPGMRAPLATFLGSKVRSVAYPYVLWSVLQTLVQRALASAANRPVEAASLLAIAYRPIMQFWFLYALFLIFMIFALGHRAGLRGVRFFVLALVLYAYPHVAPLGAWGVAYSVANNLLYFAAGVLVAEGVHGWLGAWAPRHAFAAAVTGFALMAAAVWLGVEASVPGKPIVAALGIAVTAWLAAALSGLRAFGFVHGWGLVSLQIYVAHTIASAGWRIGLQRVAGVSDPMLHIVGGIAVGLYAPILLNRACEYLGFRYAFTWPKGGAASLRQRLFGRTPALCGARGR